MDTDVALGAPRGDVDDGFALAALFRAHLLGRIRLEGVSTVSGNTTASRARGCAERIAQAAGARVEVVRGAEGTGEKTAAAERIAGLAGGARSSLSGP